MVCYRFFKGLCNAIADLRTRASTRFTMTTNGKRKSVDADLARRDFIVPASVEQAAAYGEVVKEGTAAVAACAACHAAGSLHFFTASLGTMDGGWGKQQCTGNDHYKAVSRNKRGENFSK